MDGDTERALAALILREAAELRRQADEEGIGAYLRPKVRCRPNSNFLRATVRSVEQSNRINEVNEMWKQRETESKEVSARSNLNFRGNFSTPSCQSQRQLPKSNSNSSQSRSLNRKSPFPESEEFRENDKRVRISSTCQLNTHPSTSAANPSRKSRWSQHEWGSKNDDFRSSKLNLNENISENEVHGNEDVDYCTNFSHRHHNFDLPSNLHEQDAMEDDEMERFLSTRVKRGRGSTGARMDLTGPFLLPLESDTCKIESTSDDITKWKNDTLESISRVGFEASSKKKSKRVERNVDAKEERKERKKRKEKETSEKSCIHVGDKKSSKKRKSRK